MIKKIRVLNIIGYRPRGGVGSVVYNYQTHMDQEVIQSDYLLFNDVPDGEFDIKVREYGSSVYVLPELKNSRFFLIFRRINNFFKEHAKDYDIVHLHSANIGFICLPIAKKYGINIRIIHSHSTFFSDKKLNAIRNRILCIPINMLASDYIACSKAAGEFLFGKKKFVIFKNAIDCKKYQYNMEIRNSVRRGFSLDDKLVIGNVGRFSSVKNHTFLISIFNEIKKIEKGSILLLVGDGILKENIQARVMDMGLSESVVFLGQRNDIAELIQAMDILVLPSLFEGVPVIGIEAQASNLPCIFSSEITREVGIVDAAFLNLLDDAKVWAEIIINTSKVSTRKNVTKIMENAGYDINIEAKKLQKYYTSLYEMKRSEK